MTVFFGIRQRWWEIKPGAYQAISGGKAQE